MRRAIKKAIEVFSQTFTAGNTIVEIGSFYRPGYEKLSDLRPLFPDRDYIGCDIRQGLGVDRIEDAQDLSFADGSLGAVMMFEILEHLPNPHKAVAEAHRVLADDGLLVLSVPFTYRLHGFPSDYWRFTTSGVHEMLTEFPDKIVFALGPRLKPAFIFAVAAKTVSPRFTEQKELFRERIEAAYRASRMRGFVSVLKERGRDFFGHLLGRAELTVAFFDPSMSGGYRNNEPSVVGAPAVTKTLKT